GFHCMTEYVKVAFFRGTSLRPVPPGQSKQKEVRYLDIHEDDQLDEAQMADWVKQAAALPGWQIKSESAPSHQVKTEQPLLVLLLPLAFDVELLFLAAELRR